MKFYKKGKTFAATDGKWMVIGNSTTTTVRKHHGHLASIYTEIPFNLEPVTFSELVAVLGEHYDTQNESIIINKERAL